MLAVYVFTSDIPFAVAKAQKRISKMLTRKASNAPSESNSESFEDGRYN